MKVCLLALLDCLVPDLSRGWEDHRPVAAILDEG